MREFYDKFYAATVTGQAHAEFCEHVFRRNLCQHGFADMAQLDAILDVTPLGPGRHALDLGCGNGMIAEYLSDRSGAHVTGLDYVPEAVRQAGTPTAAKHDRLSFIVGDINALDLQAGAHDTVISIDSIYFSHNTARTIGQLCAALRPGGQMAFLYENRYENRLGDAHGVSQAIEEGLQRRYLYLVQA